MKSKKILTILLSLAIMFTFMPAMAFADEPVSDVSTTAKWSANFDSATNGTDTEATYARTFDGQNVTAIAGNDKVSGANNKWHALEKYSDLGKASIEGNATWTFDYFGTHVSDKGVVTGTDLSLKMHKPDNATYADGITAASDAVFDGKYQGQTVTEGMKTLTAGTVAYDVVYTATGYDATKPYEQQTITVTAAVKAKNEYTGAFLTALNNHLLGTVTAEKQITVKAKEAKADDVQLFIDSVSTDGSTAASKGFTYDGKTHTIVSNDVPGYTVSYAVQDKKTQKYVEANPVELKDADTYSVQYTITKNSDGTKTVKYVNVKVSPVGNLQNNKYLFFKFDDSVVSATTNDGTLVRKVPADVNPVDFVEVQNVLSDADKEEAMKYFNDRFEIKVAADKVNPAYAIWTISEKSGVDLNKLKETYSTLLANYGHGQKINLSSEYAPAKVELVDNSSVATKDDDITFSGVTKKTYKAKKSTKKLAKAKSFTVKAVADSGNAIKFSATSTSSKIKINATTGKVTVKKGLKKGTYKITVKAKTAAGNGYKACKESKTYTIKVK